MADPLTLTVVGAVVLTEGIKFLYGQAGEALKRWRERKEAAEGTAEAIDSEPVEVTLPSDVFEGQLQDPRLHFEAVERLEQQLRKLRTTVADYAQGIDEVDPNSRQLRENVDALRQAMEAVYGQQLTFKGEEGRSPSGMPVDIRVRTKNVEGYVAGARGRLGGEIGSIDVQTDDVRQQGQVIGYDNKP